MFMVLPINQITFGLTAIYTIATVAAYKHALMGEPAATVGDFFVFYLGLRHL